MVIVLNILIVIDEDIIWGLSGLNAAVANREKVFIYSHIVQFLITRWLLAENPFQLFFFIPVRPEKNLAVFVVNEMENVRLTFCTGISRTGRGGRILTRFVLSIFTLCCHISENKIQIIVN